jgi:hypothetical protein
LLNCPHLHDSCIRTKAEPFLARGFKVICITQTLYKLALIKYGQRGGIKR